MIDKQEYSRELLKVADWKHTVTIRPTIKVNPVSAFNLVQRLARKLKSIIYFTLEKDTNSDHKHLHLLLDKSTTKDEVYKSLKIRKASVTYSSPICSKIDLASYVNKYIDNNNINSHHDICLDN
jgi:hypothetical protein